MAGCSMIARAASPDNITLLYVCMLKNVAKIDLCEVIELRDFYGSCYCNHEIQAYDLGTIGTYKGLLTEWAMDNFYPLEWLHLTTIIHTCLYIRPVFQTYTVPRYLRSI